MKENDKQNKKQLDSIMKGASYYVVITENGFAAIGNPSSMRTLLMLAAAQERSFANAITDVAETLNDEEFMKQMRETLGEKKEKN